MFVFTAKYPIQSNFVSKNQQEFEDFSPLIREISVIGIFGAFINNH